MTKELHYKTEINILIFQIHICSILIQQKFVIYLCARHCAHMLEKSDECGKVPGLTGLAYIQKRFAAIKKLRLKRK